MKMMSFENPCIVYCRVVVKIFIGLSTLAVTDASLSTSPLTYKHELSRQLVSGDDVVFNSHLLWTADVSSAAQCALKCLGHEGCLGFSFLDPEEEGLTGMADNCRAHSTVCSAPLVCHVPNTTAPGFRFYGFFDKAERLMLGRPCSSPSDCSSDFICFQGQCLCQAGQYYSHSGDSCIADCAQADLEASFLKYDTSTLLGSVVKGVAETSWIGCAVMCLLDPGTCRSVDFDQDNDLCFPRGENVVGVQPEFVLGSYSDYVHMQRTCK